MKTKQLALFGLFFFLSSMISAQKIVGFWKVDLVRAGDRNVPPVAKWFKYNKDHTYQAGNGWSQNDIGSWTFDKKMARFLPYNSKGEPHEFGAFLTSFKDGKMYWERQEDGVKVLVTLSPTTAMPLSSKDSIVGNWQFISVIKMVKSFHPHLILQEKRKF